MTVAYDYFEDTKKNLTVKNKFSLYGILSDYANPELIKYERDAWELAMVAKHDNN